MTMTPSGPRAVELEGLYGVAKRYLETHTQEPETATTLDDLRHALWLVDQHQPLEGETGTPLSREEYKQLREDVHAALRPEEVWKDLSGLMAWLQDDEDPESAWLGEAADKVWDAALTVATAVAAFERGRQLPSAHHEIIEGAVTMRATAAFTLDAEVEVAPAPTSELELELDPALAPTSPPEFVPDEELETVNQADMFGDPVPVKSSPPKKEPSAAASPAAPASPAKDLRSKWKRVRQPDP